LDAGGVVVTGVETAGVVGVEDVELQPEIMKAHTSRTTTGINSFFIVLLLFFLTVSWHGYIYGLDIEGYL
jgi:hypothetical protein